MPASEPQLAFLALPEETPAIEIRVNFGVFAGRAATPAELDQLAEWLLDEVPGVTIIAEERHEIDANAEASVHQVHVTLAEGSIPADEEERQELARRVLDRVDHWARLCVAERHAEIAD
ncbi:MAG TPA: hypothetical protein VLK36_06690 [Gaiellaceae bacterium]|nr:hypothetical protein [Gaiellaceae bacterium]